MELTRSIKFFLIAGVIVLSVGYSMYLQEIGGVSGAVVMFSGGSLIIASFFAAMTKFKDWLL